MIRDEVIKAIERTGPAFVPVHYANDNELTDIVCASYAPPSDWQPQMPGQTEWGYAHLTLDLTMGQVKEPALKSWDDFKDFRAPDPDAPGRFEGVIELKERYRDKYVVGVLGITGFDRMTFIRGYANLLEDLHSNLDRVVELAEIVFGFEIEMIKRYADLGLDAVFFGDDWGTQRALMISPGMWRQVFKPLYARQFKAAKERGLHVFFHSCGQIIDIIGDFIEIGVDVLNLNQITIFDMDDLARRFTGRVCFLCPVDLQRVLVRGDTKEIEALIVRMIELFGRPSGGFIGQVEEYQPLGVPKETTDEVGRLFRLHGRY